MTKPDPTPAASATPHKADAPKHDPNKAKLDSIAKQEQELCNQLAKLGREREAILNPPDDDTK